MKPENASASHKDWRCRMGRHHYVGEIDQDADAGRARTYRCARCGAWFEPPSEPEVDIEKLRRTNYFSGF